MKFMLKRMRATIAVILAIALVVPAASSYASGGTWAKEGDYLYSIVTYDGDWVPGGSQTGAVIKFTGKSHEFTVPDTLGGYPVIGIAKWGNDTHESIVHLVLPDSIICFEDDALLPTPSMQTLRLPASLRKIGYLAIGYSRNLTHLTIPDSVVEIGERAVAEAQDLQFLQLPASLQSIPKDLCEHDKSLETVVFPQQLKTIGPWAFNSCEKLRVAALPDSVEAIQEGAFSGCTNLGLEKLPSGLRTIGASAFRDTGITDVYVPDGVTEIDNLALDTGVLQTVSLPATLKKLGYSNTGKARTEFRGTMDQWEAIERGSSYSYTTIICSDGEIKRGTRYPHTGEGSTSSSIASSSPTQRPTAIASATSALTPTPTAMPAASQEPEVTPTPSSSVKPTNSAGPTSTVKPTNSAEATNSAKPTNSASRPTSTKPTGEWNPNTDMDWFRISTLQPESGQEVEIETTCGAQGLQYKLIAEPLDSSASVERLDIEPHEGVLLLPSDQTEFPSQYTHRLRVTGRNGDRILLRAEGSYADTYDSYPLSVELGTLVIRAGAPMQMQPAGSSSLQRIETEQGEAALIGMIAGSDASYTSVGDAQNMVTVPQGMRTRVVDSKGSVVPTGSPVGTGMYLELLDGNDKAVDRAVIIVKGDVAGTGLITLSQLVRIAAGFVGTKPLSYPYSLAGDWNGNGKLDLSDLVNEAKMLTSGAASAPPAPTQRPSATATATAHPTATATTTARPTQSAAPTTSAAASPTRTPQPTATARPSGSPQPTATARPSGSTEPTATVRPSANPEQTPQTTREPGVAGAAKSFNNGGSWYLNQGWLVTSFLFENESGGLTRVEYAPAGESASNKLVVEEYSPSFELLSSREVPGELPRFGAFLNGRDAYYVAWGQDNPDEDDNLTVIRVVKYDKQWNKTGAADISNAGMQRPFAYGSTRLVEAGNMLYMRSSRWTYGIADYYPQYDAVLKHSHETSVTFAIRTTDMVVTDKNTGLGGTEYASHSMNAHMLVDNENRLVLLDHADGYPRAARVTRFGEPAGAEKVIPSGSHYDTVQPVTQVKLVEFKGSSGEEFTGCAFGGFAETSRGYVTGYGDDGVFVRKSPRDIYLAYVDKSLDANSVKRVRVTTGADAKTPHIVSTGLDGGYIIWAENVDSEKINANSSAYKMCYARYDASGNVGRVQTTTGAESDCQPIVMDGKVIWYVTTDTAPVFYVLDESGLCSYPEV